jgi:anti-sigma factor RsiW
VSCAAPVGWEALVAYWAGDLDADAEARIDEHVMACASCAAESARIAAITEALRGMIPVVVTRARLSELRGKGLRVREQTLTAGARTEVHFDASLDLLVFRLPGVDLARAERVSVAMRVTGTDQVLVEVADAPFDREEGAVLLVCQRHYAALPPVVDAEVRARDAAGAEERATFTIDHRFEPAP